METECSSPHSQAPTTCPCPEIHQSSPWSQTHFLKLQFDTVLLQSTISSSKCSISLTFHHRNPVCNSPIPPYVVHNPPIWFILIWSHEKFPNIRVFRNFPVGIIQCSTFNLRVIFCVIQYYEGRLISKAHSEIFCRQSKVVMRAQCVLVATTLLHRGAKFHSFLYTGSKTVRVNMESCYGGMSTRLK